VNLASRVIFGVVGFWSGLALCGPLTSTEITTLPRPTVEARLSSEPWPSNYIYVSRLLHEGDKDDAVFWYYVGQLRGRIYYAAHPEDQEGQEAFSATTLQMGESINFYAGADPVKWAGTIDKVLAWDAEHDDPQTPKDKYQVQRDQVRQGLVGLHDWTLEHIAQLQAAHKSATKR
jgi:hypothetical protein